MGNKKKFTQIDTKSKLIVFLAILFLPKFLVSLYGVFMLSGGVIDIKQVLFSLLFISIVPFQAELLVTLNKKWFFKLILGLIINVPYLLAVSLASFIPSSQNDEGLVIAFLTLMFAILNLIVIVFSDNLIFRKYWLEHKLIKRNFLIIFFLAILYFILEEFIFLWQTQN